MPSDSKCQQAICLWGTGTRRDRVFVSQQAVCSLIFPFTKKKNEVRAILCLQSLILSHNTTNSFPSPAGAHKGTARSRRDSPQYHMITRRRSSWQASSGSTAAEPSPTPRELQARSWKPSWNKDAADKITPHTARRHGRGGWRGEVEREKQCGCLGSTEEKPF